MAVMSARTIARPTARSRRNAASDSTSGNSGTRPLCPDSTDTIGRNRCFVRLVLPGWGEDRYRHGQPATVIGSREETPMGFIKTAVKGAVVAKLMQIAQRELSKPENQRKAKEMFQKMQQRRRPT